MTTQNKFLRIETPKAQPGFMDVGHRARNINQTSTKHYLLVIIAFIFQTITVSAQNNNNKVFPLAADVRHATKDVTVLINSFFMAKSRHNVKETMQFFSKNIATYTDATLGLPINSYAALYKFYNQYMPKWPESGLSYPTRIIGGNGSAIVSFTNTPELFGGEVRILGVVDFKDGKIVRWVDYWDSRNFNTEIFMQMKTPKEKFPTEFKESIVGENATDKIKSICTRLQDAFAKGDAEAAAGFFSYDAVYEDMSLRNQLLGKSEIFQYLAKALSQLPFGKDSKLRHIVGNDLGGGFEWIGTSNTQVSGGVTAVELNEKGLITRITTVYDSRQIEEKHLLELALISLKK